MFDFEDAYSLLFTGILLVALFLISNNIVLSYTASSNELLTGSLLLSKALNYSRLLYNSFDYSMVEVHNLELNESFSKTYNNTIVLPCVILDADKYYSCRVAAYE